MQMQRRALQNSAAIGAAPLRILEGRAIPAAIPRVPPALSRAGFAALCGFETLDMHGFSSDSGHEQGVESLVERVHKFL